MSRRWLAEKIAKITNEYNTSKPKDALEAETVCDRDGEVYWESLNQCMADEVVAVSDETTHGKLVMSSGTVYALSGTTKVGGVERAITWGETITGSGYISYVLPDYSWLAGKTVEIELDNKIPDSGQHILVHMNGDIVMNKQTGSYTCYWKGVATSSPLTYKACNASITKSGDEKNIKIFLPSTGITLGGTDPFTALRFGNSLSRKSPIEAKIKSIKIKN